jgi:antitoxin YefM
MKEITISKFRNNLKMHLDSVIENQDPIIIQKNNRDEDAVVIMSMKEFSALSETGYLLSTEANRKRLEESISQLKLSQNKNE